MAYATAADLIARKDSRTLGQLVSDTGTPVSEASLSGDTKLSASLDEASGMIEAACLNGQRYTAAELTALTGNSLAYLKGIVCDIAFWRLFERKPEMARGTAYEGAMKRAMELLDMLRKGQHVFNVERAKEAGLPHVKTVTTIDQQDLNEWGFAARGHLYPARSPG